MIVPHNNCETRPHDESGLELIKKLEVMTPPRLVTMSAKLQAGFYSTIKGPLPFAVGGRL